MGAIQGERLRQPVKPWRTRGMAGAAEHDGAAGAQLPASSGGIMDAVLAVGRVLDIREQGR